MYYFSVRYSPKFCVRKLGGGGTKKSQSGRQISGSGIKARSSRARRRSPRESVCSISVRI
jgi:hypothetical protein